MDDMTFEEILDQAADMLQRRGRVSYKAFYRQFGLDKEYLKDLKYELVNIQKVAVDEGDEMLVWVGGEKDIKTSETGDFEASKRPRPVLQKDIAERRQLTVMFIDLVGSTQLSQLIDPEDLREILYQYQDLCDKVITQHKGIVMQHSGDGIVAYFGYPIANEDDAGRAVMSGLSILESLGDLNKSLSIEKDKSLEVRIGVHTGLVVVGATGGKAHSEITAIGEVPNLAARIQSAAEVNTIVISDTTNKLISGNFKTLSLGSFKLRGFDEPLELYQVITRKESHLFDITSFVNSNQLVGREAERQIILERWELARGSKGQVILVSGEAGIGKSHLVQSMVKEIASGNTPVLSFQCSPFHRNTAFQPFIDRMHHEVILSRNEDATTNLHQLGVYLKSQGLTESNDYALCAMLLSLPLPSQYEEMNMSSDRRKTLTIACIVRWLLGGKEPSLILVEDLQWADPSSLELLDLFKNQNTLNAVLFVGTFRPEFQTKWELGSHISQIDLKHLNREQSEAIINQVAHNLPPEVVADLLSKTDGNPLFIEEVTKLVLESGVVENNKGVYLLKGSLKALSIPKTLRDSLMARLDQLGPAKKVAQIGATIGREFPYNLIKAISGIDQNTLNDYLQKLVFAELLLVQGEIPDAIFTFKHALIQETAYSSLLKKQNKEFHKRIVENLEQSFPDIVLASPELLAHHCNAAGLLEKAVPYWKRAGDLAISRSAHAEAISHLNTGLSILKDLPDSQENINEEILFQIALGVPLTALRGYGSIEVEQAYERARFLCQQAGETWQLVPALYGLWRYYLLRAQYREALELSDQILSLSQQSDDPVHFVVGHRASGSTKFYLGKLTSARDHLNEIFTSEASSKGLGSVLPYDVVDAWITAQSYASLNYWLLGYPDQAMEHSKKSIAMAEQLRHPFSKALSLCFAAWLHQFRAEFNQTLECSRQGLEIAKKNGFTFWIGWGTILKAWAQEGKDSVAQLSMMKEGLETWHATQSELGSSYFLFLLAQSFLDHGDQKEAWNCLDKAKKFVEVTGEKWWEAELYRLEGVLLLASEVPNNQKAEQCYRQALKIAASQNARSLELRAALNLAKLLANTPSSTEGYTILKEVVDWFNEGLELPDMLEARKLLKYLSSTEIPRR